MTTSFTHYEVRSATGRIVTTAADLEVAAGVIARMTGKGSQGLRLFKIQVSRTEEEITNGLAIKGEEA